MILRAVNVSQPLAVEIEGRRYHTGIYKRAVSGRLWLGRLGLAGDGQADMEAHGGPHRALYVYPHEHYAVWANELERDDFDPGEFGENLTTIGLLEDDVCIGDIYGIGEAAIQVSQPRVPCYKLANKLGIPGFAKTFLRQNKSGFYARTVQEGSLGAGDEIQLLERDAARVTVAEVNAALHIKKDPDVARRAAELEALSPEWRRSFKKLLAETVTPD